MKQNYTMGALPPKYDARDYSIAAAAGNYPDEFQLSWHPEIKNQGAVGSCVAHSTSEILEYFNYQETGSIEQLSTDFIYGMQGVAFDRLEAGMFLRDACKIVTQYGDCYQSTIDTNTEQPKCTEKLKAILNDNVYKEAYNFHTKSYAKCKNDDAIKHALMNYGPVLVSIKWYEKSDISADGVLVFDMRKEAGYHAVMVCGWTKKGWLCQNSWGKNWGKNGMFILPFNIGFSEAWSFVDAANADVQIPIKRKWTDIFYKPFNWIVNLLKHLLPWRP